jgi:hypothetical protein
MKLFYNDKSAIDISHNPIQYDITKHIYLSIFYQREVRWWIGSQYNLEHC